MCVCVCVFALSSTGQLAGCGLLRWRCLGGSGGETAGVATIGSQVLSVTSAPPSTPSLLPTSVPPFCLYSVRERCGVCYWGRLTALMHISLTAALPAVTIRKEHMPELGTTSEEPDSASRPFFVTYSTRLKVCGGSDRDSHLNGTEVWLCLTDSNASQMDPITCLIVATSCLPFLFSGSMLHFSPVSQMRQSYQRRLLSLYFQGLLTGGCGYFCLAIKQN